MLVNVTSVAVSNIQAGSFSLKELMSNDMIIDYSILIIDSAKFISSLLFLRDCTSKLKRENAYRFAVCFICKEEGHLAKV